MSGLVSPSARYWLAAAGVYGSLAIALGAFGAHGLPGHLEDRGFDAPDIERRIELFDTASRYHIYAALAMLGVGAARLHSANRAWGVACWLLLLGSLEFCGLIYALAVVGPGLRWLGMLVPLGGVAMILGWAAIAVGAFQLPTASRD